MKSVTRIIGITLAMALAACGGETVTTGDAANAQVDSSRDWTETVSATEGGGFVMGNPDAPVKVIEYASLTCPHCAAFSSQGYEPLTEQYVARGLVSFELRNFVLNGLDLGASVLSRCNGAEPYFALTERFFANQTAMMQAAQTADPAELQAIASLPQSQQMARALLGDAEPAAVAELERIRNEGVEQHNIPGTPTFLINGEVEQGVTTWTALKARLDELVQ